MDKLAINGGKPLIPKDLIKPWPPISALDRKMVLASLNGHKHAFGPNCSAFEKEFADWNGISTPSAPTAGRRPCTWVFQPAV